METPRGTAVLIAVGLACVLLTAGWASAQAQPDFAILKGRWVRTDGGYVIGVQSVDAGGRIDDAALPDERARHQIALRSPLAGSLVARSLARQSANSTASHRKVASVLPCR